jgi:hypothetical protein
VTFVHFAGWDLKISERGKKSIRIVQMIHKQLFGLREKIKKPESFVLKRNIYNIDGHFHQMNRYKTCASKKFTSKMWCCKQISDAGIMDS